MLLAHPSPGAKEGEKASLLTQVAEAVEVEVRAPRFASFVGDMLQEAWVPSSLKQRQCVINHVAVDMDQDETSNIASHQKEGGVSSEYMFTLEYRQALITLLLR